MANVVEPLLVPPAPPARSPLPLRARRWAFLGPGAVVAAGYVDPGNWATDIAGGSKYGYQLLSVVVLSSLAAMLFQTLSARLGVATGKDLAQITREQSPRWAVPNWLGCELAMIATDVAEVVGSALALQMLFHMPLPLGVIVTGLDVALVLLWDRGRGRRLEMLVAGLVGLMAFGFAYELSLTRPVLRDVFAGIVPTTAPLRDPLMLYAAIGIVGATVMPHNLYLHSRLVADRALQARSGWSQASLRQAARSSTIDTVISLSVAMVMNAALLVLAATAFHAIGLHDVADISDAHRLLEPLLGSSFAPVVFALTLLAAGQSATVSGTMAGEVVMGGFLDLRWPRWKRRLVTRACAIVPALVIVLVRGDGAAGQLLVFSQVLLGLQLPFALVPLVRATSSARIMGVLRTPAWLRLAGWSGALAIIVANGVLLVQLARG